MESMKGFVTFEDKKYPFSFSGERLALYPDEFSSQSLQEFFAPFERGNTIKDIELNGITANRKKVVFEVSEQYSDMQIFIRNWMYVLINTWKRKKLRWKHWMD